ncbi:MAG: hypothetical protein QW175_02795 [Candidatus Bathyarchaeia archaeon]
MLWLFKRLADFGLWFMARVAERDKVVITDERLNELDEVLETMETLEFCPMMRRRWRDLRRCLIYLLARDGQYKWRTMLLIRLLVEDEHNLSLKSWEKDFIRRQTGIKV